MVAWPDLAERFAWTSEPRFVGVVLESMRERFDNWESQAVIEALYPGDPYALVDMLRVQDSRWVDPIGTGLGRMFQQALIASLRRTNSLSRVCVAAFSDGRLRKLRKALGADLCSSLGPLELTLLRFGLLRNPPGLAAQVPVKQGPLTVVNAAFIERTHRLGMQVHVWTIDDAAEMNRLLDLGVDGIMTDRPVLLREVLESRGAWNP